MENEEFKQQIDFLLKMDELKKVYRRTYILKSDRHENDAEHSWHLSMMALILHKYANGGVDILHVLKMVIIHDIVEIDVGDTFCYDEEAAAKQADREKQASKRLFGLLPESQATEFRDLWEEFEEGSSPEAKFARSLDRLMPMLHNYYSGGKAWKEHGIKKDQVLNRNRVIADGSEKLWSLALSLINKAVDKGYLAN